MKVLVLLGGTSGEREVSLRSGKAVIQVLKSLGYRVLTYDPAEGNEGLSAFIGKVDCVLPILHGKGGEDGAIQECMENLGFKFLGANSRVSRTCFDKVKFKEELIKCGITTPAGELVTADNIKASPLIKKPYVLKPVDGGSSLDTFIIRDPLVGSYDYRVFERNSRMLLEELVFGTEITVPVLGDKALPVIEIIPPEGKEFDYKNKYNGATQEFCPPVNVTTEKQEEAQRLAEQIHLGVGVRHLSRTDMIIDHSGKLWVLELNTMPGMTDQSLFPNAARCAGISMKDLVKKLVDLANTS